MSLLRFVLIGSLAAASWAQMVEEVDCHEQRRLLQVQPVVVVNPPLAPVTETWTRTILLPLIEPTTTTTATLADPAPDPASSTSTTDSAPVVDPPLIPGPTETDRSISTSISSTADPSITSASSTTGLPDDPPSTTSDIGSTTTIVPDIDPPPLRACAGPIPSCPDTGLTLQRFENIRDVLLGFGPSNGITGVGRDYYLEQGLPVLGQGVTPTIVVPRLDPGPPEVNPPTPGVPGSTVSYGNLFQTYGGMTYDANNFTLVFNGYFVPQETGSHEFCANADNRAAIFVGSDGAFPCGGSPGDAIRGATPVAESWFNNPMLANRQCGDVDLVAGFWYPFRIVFGNWGSPSSFSGSIEPPSGQLITGGPQFQQVGCLSS